jgi:hypothetical protein
MMSEISQADENIKTIRVYPDHAFVPNAYKYRAETTALHATRGEDGTWTIASVLVDAHRPHGSGPKITHNGRS